MRRLETGRVGTRLNFNSLNPEYEANSPALLREFENKAQSNNQSVKKVSTEYFTTIYNKMVKSYRFVD